MAKIIAMYKTPLIPRLRPLLLRTARQTGEGRSGLKGYEVTRGPS